MNSDLLPCVGEGIGVLKARMAGVFSVATVVILSLLPCPSEAGQAGSGGVLARALGCVNPGGSALLDMEEGGGCCVKWSG